ncbi:MAG: nuclear transport factor 2 family protein [Acidimicrobiales bacterium]
MATEDADRAIHQDVADVLVRYATGIDRRDWTLFRTCFTDDCEADYGDIGVWTSAEAITDWMAQMHAPCGHTLHRITNIAVSSTSGGVAARCYVDALVMAPDGQTGTRASGWYDDELVDTDEGWKIARRRFTMVHLDMGTGAGP